MRNIIKILGTAAAVYLASRLVGGITVDDFWTAILVGFVLAILNAIIKPILQLISFPLIVLTLGLFLVVINAVLLLLASDIVPDFAVDGFWSAVWGSLIISLVSYILDPPRNNDNDQDGNSNGFSVRVDRNN